METQLSVTITGANLNALIEGAQKFVSANQAAGKATTQKSMSQTAPTTTKVSAKKAAQVEETEDDLLTSDDEDTDLTLGEDDDETMSFDSEDEEIEEQKPAPKKTKITDKDVNAAAMAHAKKYKKAATLELLQKKFKVKSIMELKPDQYEAAIKALKV